MKIIFASIFLLACTLLVAPYNTFAQSGNQGALEGSVSDSSGAVVPGAIITATNQANGIKSTVSTSQDGLYVFPVLTVGVYELRVEHSGFATLIRKEVSITVGAKVNLSLTLSVAGAAESTTVTAEAPIVETTRTQVSNTVNEESVSSLPVNGRNFIDFVLLTPGVTRDVRTGDISFAGQRGTLNSLTVDGADSNNTFFGQTTGRTGSGRAPYQFSQDAVQEFQVNSNGYSAELGRSGGAVVNVITKSGTNKLHGTGFWFYRDRALNADDPVNKLNAGLRNQPVPRKPDYHFNQFGGNIGGPVIKDKLFFFFDYDGQRNTQPNTVIYSPPAISANAAIAANQLVADAYLRARAGAWSRGLDQNTYLAKGDWSVNAKNQLSIRYNRQNFTGTGFENGGSANSSEHTGAAIVNTDTISASVTTIISPSMVNVGRFNYQVDSEPGQANSNLPEATVGPSATAFLVVGRNFFSPRETTIHRQQYVDTFTYTRGRHTFKAGLDILHDGILNFFPGNFSGSYSFSSLQDFGCSLQGKALTAASCPGLTGNDSLTQAFAGTGTTGATTHPDINQYAFFVQDDWRVRSNLTVNLGIRYDLQSTAQPPVRNPVAAAVGIFTDQIHTDTNNVGPRVGFAWTPTKDGSYVFRGGYGIFYGVTPSIMVGTAHSNNGINVQTQTFTPTTATVIPSYPNTICGAPVDSPNCAAPTGGSSSPPTIFVMQPDYQQPIIQQANLGWEWQAEKDTSVSIGYLFVKGNHLQRTRDINLPASNVATVPITGSGQVVTYNSYRDPVTGFLNRPIGGLNTFGRISQFEGSANSVYHGLTAQVNKRMSHNFLFTGAYTWGHVIDDVPDATAVVPSGGDDAKLLFDNLNPRADRASGVNDQRHRLVLSGIWQLKYANSLPGGLKAVFGGWELSSIFTGQSGQPYSGLTSGDLNGDSNRRTDYVPFEGRNHFRLPATYSLDPRVTKNLPITENFKLQFFAEAFNLFNHFNVTNVRTTEYAITANATAANTTACGPAFRAGVPCALVPQTTGTTAFGLPTGHSGARILQLGAKINF